MDYVFQIDTGTEIDFHYNKTVKRDDSRIQKWLWSYIIWRKKALLPVYRFHFLPKSSFEDSIFQTAFSKKQLPTMDFLMFKFCVSIFLHLPLPGQHDYAGP